MNCHIAGFVGLGMLVATYATMSISKEEKRKLQTAFTPNLDEIYHRITLERRDIYLEGLIIGLVVSFLLARSWNLTNNYHKSMLFLGITIVVSVVYYMIMPKSDSMKNYLHTEDELKAWSKNCETMRNRYVLGFVLGSLASVPISQALC